jgi:hypothetical protein
MDPMLVVNSISKLPAKQQSRFMQLLISYVQVMASYADKGFVVMGMQDVVYACRDLLEVLEAHFPVIEQEPKTVEYMQI